MKKKEKKKKGLVKKKKKKRGTGGWRAVVSQQPYQRSMSSTTVWNAFACLARARARASQLGETTGLAAVRVFGPARVLSLLGRTVV